MELTIKLENIFSLFTKLITNIQRCINKIKDANMKALGLKSGHVSCLYYLYKMGPLTQGELCEVCDENKAAISRKIEYLTKNEYTKRDNSNINKYKLPIILTQKGKEIAEYIDTKVNQVISESNAELNDYDRQILYSSLERINQKLNKIIKSEGK